MPLLRLGTRKSLLAQTQAQLVATALQKKFSEARIEIIHITTSGDNSLAPAPKQTAGGLKALFTKELEEALLQRKIDFAVHSLKDMTPMLPAGLMLAAVPEREDPLDAWISAKKLPLAEVPQGAKVGTNAVRRQAQLRRLRPDLELIPLRGNVDTRLASLTKGELDGMVLAMAGLKRLQLQGRVTETFSIEQMVPAAGQGCLGIQTRLADSLVLRYVKALDHAPSHAAADAERAFVAALGGSCQSPIGAHAMVAQDQLALVGRVISPDGKNILQGTETGPVQDASAIGHRLATELLRQGAKSLLS